MSTTATEKTVAATPAASKLTTKHYLEAGSHFGHKASRWNPKMKPFIHMVRKGTHIIDIAKSIKCFDAAYALLEKITKDGGQVLFVGTKTNGQAIVKKSAIRTGSHFVTQRWLGGTLTNFKNIQNSVDRLANILKMEKSGEITKYTKKEQVELEKEKEKLTKFVGGIKRMRYMPKAIVILDPATEVNAVKEARNKNIPIIGITDTNGNPDDSDFIVPANVNSRRSIALMVQGLADAIAEAKGEPTLIVGQEPGANLPESLRKKYEATGERRPFNRERRPFNKFNGEKKFSKDDRKPAATK